MPTSEARVRANQRNAQLSTGPKTDEGKARSRGNAVKHGLTGEGIALPTEDAAEVERRFQAFEAELKPTGEMGRTLVRRVALMAVRMDRCVAQETAALSEHVRRAEADFDAEWPEVEGEDDPDRERMRVEAARRAMFDPSKEACLARKYEAAAERGFFRALKELRQVEREAKAAGTAPVAVAAPSALGSFSPGSPTPSATPPGGPKPVAPAPIPSPKPVPTFPVAPMSPVEGLFAGVGRSFEVPFTIGRAG